MPVLEKQRYELFCTGIAKGLTPAIAYVQAGFKDSSPAASAWKLQKRQIIANRIAELQREIADRASGVAPMTGIEMAIAERDGQVRAKWERYKLLCQILTERAAHYSDPMNPLVRQLAMSKADAIDPSKKPNLARLPGITTGLVYIEMRLLGKTAVPVLKEDTALLRSLSALEAEIAQLMGFLQPITIDASTTNNNTLNVNQTTVKIVHMIPAPADKTGQW